MKKELTVECMIDKLDKKIISMLEKMSDDEIFFLYQFVNTHEIFSDALADRYNDAVKNIVEKEYKK